MPDSPPLLRPITRPRGSAASADPELAPGTRLGDWVVEAKIGEGGMGTVYSAVHAEIGKQAALKVIHAAMCAAEYGSERFVQEARVVNQIGHPNIVDIFHIGRLDDGRPYLVMELLRGQNLGDRLASGRVPAAESCDLLLQMCGALAAAHAQGVIHRDLKPDNVFLIETAHGPMVKLLDWGIAKLSVPGLAAATVTRSGVLVGTPQYISPEQARGKPVDASADIYSLGAIAYELFLEAPPFTADNIADVIAMHLCVPVPAPSDVWPAIPAALESLLLRMLAKEPGGRPTLPEVSATLIAVRDGLDTRTQRHRLAAGSLPPPMTSGDHGRMDTLLAGLPVVGASSRPSPVHARGSGPMDAIDPEAHGLAARPAPRPRHASPTLGVPTRASWRWWLGGGLVGATAITATVIMASADRRPRVERHQGEPTVDAPVGPPTPTPAPALAPSGLELRVTPSTARIRIDGEDLSAADGRATRALTPGRHLLVVEARGHQPHRRTVEITSGSTLVIDVALAPLERRPSRRSGRRPPAEPVNPDGTIDPFE